MPKWDFSKVNVLVYKKLSEQLEDFRTRAIKLEHEVADCINQQRINGWLIDERKANILYAGLCEKKQSLIDKVHETFKPLPTFVPLTDLKNKYNADGMYSVAYQKQLDRGAFWKTPKEWGCIEYPELDVNDVIRRLETSLDVYMEHVELWKAEGRVELLNEIKETNNVENITAESY